MTKAEDCRAYIQAHIKEEAASMPVKRYMARHTRLLFCFGAALSLFMMPIGIALAFGIRGMVLYILNHLEHEFGLFALSTHIAAGAGLLLGGMGVYIGCAIRAAFRLQGDELQKLKMPAEIADIKELYHFLSQTLTEFGEWHYEAVGTEEEYRVSFTYKKVHYEADFKPHQRAYIFRTPLLGLEEDLESFENYTKKKSTKDDAVLTAYHYYYKIRPVLHYAIGYFIEKNSTGYKV